MLRRNLADVNGTDRDLRDDWWRSRRLLVAADGLPYSFHITTIHPGASLHFEYEGHRETVYCIAGSGTLLDKTTGETFDIERGSVYSAGVGEPHEVVANTEMTLVCVFDPPLEGTEEAD